MIRSEEVGNPGKDEGERNLISVKSERRKRRKIKKEANLKKCLNN